MRPGHFYLVEMQNDAPDRMGIFGNPEKRFTVYLAKSPDVGISQNAGSLSSRISKLSSMMENAARFRNQPFYAGLYLRGWLSSLRHSSRGSLTNGRLRGWYRKKKKLRTPVTARASAREEFRPRALGLTNDE